MKRAIAILCLVIMLFVPVEASAVDNQVNPYGEPFPMLTTAYLDSGITASGCQTREGICAAKKEWIGMTAIIYERTDDNKIGELLGIYEILDTGFGGDSDGDGIGSIQEGKVIDVWFPTYDLCVEWMKKTNGRCFVQLVNAQG